MCPTARLGLFFALLSAAAFGIYPSAARFAYADGANLTFIVLLTTGMRMLVFWAFCGLMQKRIFARRQDIHRSAAGGFLQAVSVACVFGALLYIPGPVMIITVFTYPLMLLFLMSWKGEVKMDGLTLTATFAAFTGLTLVLDLWSGNHLYNAMGMGLSFAAALATAVRLFVHAHELKTRSPAIVGAENFIFAVIFLLPLCFFMMPQAPASLAGFGIALVGAVTQGAASLSMFYGIAALGAFRFSLFLKLEPVFTALFAVLLVNEVLSWQQYAGMAGVLASLLTYQYIEGRRRNAIPDAPVPALKS